MDWRSRQRNREEVLRGNCGQGAKINNGTKEKNTESQVS